VGETCKALRKIAKHLPGSDIEFLGKETEVVAGSDGTSKNFVSLRITPMVG